MLAVSRTDRVIGRIMFLVNSISTIKGIRPIGDPLGTKWLRDFLVFLIAKRRLIESQIINARGKLREI